MAGVSIADYGALHVKYLPGVVPTLNNTVKVRKLAGNYKWEGDHIEFFVHTARNSAVGNISDGGAIPVADKQDMVTAKAFRRFSVGSVQASEGILAAAATSESAAKSVVESELRGMMDGIAKYENGMLYRSGTGVVATVKTGTATTDLRVDDARMLWDGAVYQEYDSTLATNYGNVTISKTARALDANGFAQVTLTSAIPNGTVGNVLVWNNSLNLTFTGLDKLVDDASATFQNINTATYPRYTSVVVDNGGTLRPLTPTLFRRVLAGILQESGEKPDGIVTIANVWGGIEFEELYEAELRITPDTKVGGTAMASFQSSFGKITVETDSDALRNKIFFVDFSQVFRAVQKELDWRKSGGEIFTPSQGSLVYTATAVEISEYFIKRRNTCGKLEDVSETASTAY